MKQIRVNTEIVNKTNADFFANVVDLVSDEKIISELKGYLESGETEIELLLNSPGGDLAATASIINEIAAFKKTYNFHLTTIISGVAFSGAFLIFMIGDTRKVGKLSRGMAHPAISSFYSTGHLSQIREDFTRFETAIEVANSTIYAFFKSVLSDDVLGNMGITEKFFNGKGELFFTGQDLVDLGLADLVDTAINNLDGGECIGGLCTTRLLAKYAPQLLDGVKAFEFPEMESQEALENSESAATLENSESSELPDLLVSDFIKLHIDFLSKSDILNLVNRDVEYAKDVLIENLKCQIENQEEILKIQKVESTNNRLPEMLNKLSQISDDDYAPEILIESDATMDFENMTVEELLELAKAKNLTHKGKPILNAIPRISQVTDIRNNQREMLINLLSGNS
jgi:ATP-dependent protease ClpP protease subunit